MNNTALFPRFDAADSKIAIELATERLSYRALREGAAAFSAALDREGIPKDATVALWAQPDLRTAIALVGNLWSGRTTLPLNPKLGQAELAHVLRDAAPDAIFAADPSQLDAPQRSSDPPTRAITLEGKGDLAASTPDPESIGLLLYTSGTTGAPKGAQISRRAIAANLDALADNWNWTERDVIVHALPLFHVHGLVLGLLGPLRVGGSLIHRPHFEARDLAASLTRAKQLGDPVLFSVPTMIRRLGLLAEGGDPVVREGLQAARLLVSGSAGLPTREHRRIEAACGRGVHERYGLTETLINCGVRASSPPRPGYVGPALKGVELKLVDDERHPIDAWDDATIGEVAVRGPSLFSGYLNRTYPNRTSREGADASLDAEGFYYTGDLATRAPDGAIRLVGRRSVDLIKSGGYKVGAQEIEACILELEGVDEVAVLGAPDADLGQRIVAYVVGDPQARPSADRIIAEVAEQLTPHKRPREVRFVEALPRNAMGKIQKKKLLEE